MKKSYIIVFIYCFFLLFSIFKMFYYATTVGRFPDESMHIAYVAYLDATNRIVPDFREMRGISISEPGDKASDAWGDAWHTMTFSTAYNYLGHPPLYYQVMRLSGAIREIDGNMQINQFYLRRANILLSSSTLIILFISGYLLFNNSIKKNFLFAAISTSIPMLLYTCAGVNNDNLAFLLISSLVLVLILYSNKNTSFWLYFAIGLLISLAFLTKLTAGLIAGLISLLYFIISYIMYKNYKIFINWKFLFSCFLLFFPVAYYVYVYSQVGSFQPSYAVLFPEQFRASAFWVPEDDRVNMGRLSYLRYYIQRFFGSWYSIQSHISLPKAGNWYNVNKIALLSLCFAPLCLLLPWKRHRQPDKYGILPIALSVYFSVVITSFIQFYNAYSGYINRGYLGGYQSRYYTCAIAGIALCSVLLYSYFSRFLHDIFVKIIKFKNNYKYNKLIYNMFTWSIVICISVLFIYEDIIYFVYNFYRYLSFG